MIKTEWNATLREALARMLELPLDRILQQGQAEGLATSDSFCTFYLESMEQMPDAYETDKYIKAWYRLFFVISVYDKQSFDRVMSLMLKLHTQQGKEALNYGGLKYTEATILNRLTEYINGISYQRADLRLQLAAEHCEFIELPLIETVDFELKSIK